MMDFQQNFTTTVRRILAEKRMTIKQLAKVTGISVKYLYGLLSNDRRWNADSVAAVCEALNISIRFDVDTMAS